MTTIPGRHRDGKEGIDALVSCFLQRVLVVRSNRESDD